MDWQTTFYIVSIIVMIAFTTFLAFLIYLLHRLRVFIEKSLGNITTIGAVAKLSALRMLLKLVR